jgi:hypothetical protein
MKISIYITLLVLTLSSCWPSSVGFQDKGSMPEEWETFSVKTLDNNSATAPNSYPSLLTEALKDGIQNNTRLLLNTNNGGEIIIEGAIISYNVSPIALQPGDVAAQNRLTISVKFTIFITEPNEEKMELSLSKFMDFNSNQDMSSVEGSLLTEINAQIVQDVVAKLLSNW